MTGSVNAYITADGGSGAAWLSALRHRARALRPVDSPRHADLLVVVEPVSDRLVPAVAEIYRAIPAPRRALAVGRGRNGHLDATLPGLRRVDAEAPLERVVATARELPPTMDEPAPVPEPITLRLPAAHERELATEPVVLSLGPLQRFAAGPVRLLLVCDGEQAVWARVESGYARRDIAQRMRDTGWGDGLAIAETLDPLAPVVGRLAYVTALERLAGEPPAPEIALAREAVLAVERAENQLWWFERFATVLAHDRLADQAYALATEIADAGRALWSERLGMWLVPGGGCPGSVGKGPSRLVDLAATVGALLRAVERNRFLRLRLYGVGTLDPGRAREAGISGPVLQASAEATGDCWARMTLRLRQAQDDLLGASRALAVRASAGRRFDGARAGTAQVAIDGPRGQLSVAVTSDGGERPARVAWRTPSAKTLSVVGDLLRGATLADAEAIVASLDLAMAEADG